MKSKQNKTDRRIEKKGNDYIEYVTIEYELDAEGLQQRIDTRENALKTESNAKQRKILEDDIKYFKDAKLNGKSNKTLIHT